MREHTYRVYRTYADGRPRRFLGIVTTARARAEDQYGDYSGTALEVAVWPIKAQQALDRAIARAR